jgi:hypothetical protein
VSYSTFVASSPPQRFTPSELQGLQRWRTFDRSVSSIVAGRVAD